MANPTSEHETANWELAFMITSPEKVIKVVCLWVGVYTRGGAKPRPVLVSAESSEAGKLGKVGEVGAFLWYPLITETASFPGTP